MIELTDEFGAKVYLMINTIKYFKENVGGMYAPQHTKAKSALENVYGDIFYVKETCEEILTKLFNGKQNQNEE